MWTDIVLCLPITSLVRGQRFVWNSYPIWKYCPIVLFLVVLILKKLLLDVLLTVKCSCLTLCVIGLYRFPFSLTYQVRKFFNVPLVQTCTHIHNHIHIFEVSYFQIRKMLLELFSQPTLCIFQVLFQEEILVFKRIKTFIVNENRNRNFRGLLDQNSLGLCDKTRMN